MSKLSAFRQIWKLLKERNKLYESLITSKGIEQGGKKAEQAVKRGAGAAHFEAIELESLHPASPSNKTWMR